ncbi:MULTISPECIES: hypothetical protein [unclassified Morganella (in: enterobacteria)]|uniref:hypothetical protein n=1 Tax=unclassified Morganella (in: enterobacteria) TaxID=2676694 RepID=UPI00294386DA|nr:MULTISPECIES: hypothetical protein [unclassified Morganella (in: enterobacteria)]
MIIIVMVIGSALGAITTLIYLWSKGKTCRLISFCVAAAGILVIVVVLVGNILVVFGGFISDITNYKENPYQESLGKYYSEECTPLVLSGGSISGEINIIKCNETILQIDAAEYDNAIRAYNKSVSNPQG